MARSRFIQPALASMTVVTAIVAMTLIGVAPAHAAITPTKAYPSGLDGGGEQNTVARNPNSTGVVISGADVAGFQRGTGNGTLFYPRNAGATSSADLSVASVVAYPGINQLVYAGTGGGAHACGTPSGYSPRVI